MRDLLRRLALAGGIFAVALAGRLTLGGRADPRSLVVLAVSALIATTVVDVWERVRASRRPDR
jgi:hypothetical protein